MTKNLSGKEVLESNIEYSKSKVIDKALMLVEAKLNKNTDDINSAQSGLEVHATLLSAVLGAYEELITKE